jgi:neuroligin
VALQVSIHLSCKGRLPLSHPESDLAPCLRKKPLSELLSFVPETPRFLSPFAPYIDNILLRSPKLSMEGSEFSSNEQFKKSQLLLIFTTSEGVHELNDAECRYGFESEHRDRILRTLVRNVFNYHQQEIFSIVRNEYTDWERPILHPIPLRDATVEALSDCLVIAPAIQLALTHAKLLSAKNTYLLHFSHVARDLDFTPYEVSQQTQYGPILEPG